MKAYKLTAQDFTTNYGTLWGENLTHKIAPEKRETVLCADAWLHFYCDPLIAVLMNPAHANIKKPILWESEAEGEILHEPLKSGCKILTTIKQIPLPEISKLQKIAFGILCAKEIYENTMWQKWADNWLNNVDRTAKSAAIASKSAISATDNAAADTAAKSAATGATNAAYAASIDAAYAAGATSIDAATAYIASSVAADAACIATKHELIINFVKLAQKALTIK